MTVSECITEPSTSSLVAPAGVFGDKASRVRVLLVEGDPQMRATLAAVLARQGFDVESFDKHRRRTARRARSGAVPRRRRRLPVASCSSTWPSGAPGGTASRCP